MPPLCPAIAPAPPTTEEQWPSFPGVDGGSLASWRAQLQLREEWLNDQLASLRAERAEFCLHKDRLQKLWGDRRHRLHAAVLAHKDMLEESERSVKQREEAAEERIKQREEAADQMIKQKQFAAIESLNEADAILASARSNNGPPLKKPRGSVGRNCLGATHNSTYV